MSALGCFSNLLKRALVALSVLTLLSLPQFSLAQQAIPLLSGRVIDQTETLTASEIGALDQTLRNFEARKGSQFAVLIVPSTQPESIEQFAIRVADQWKIGRKKIDDGVILIVAKSDRKLRIEVGYGLEGALTDATSKRIIDQVIVPRFKQQDFYGGISSGVDTIIGVIDGEGLPPPIQDRSIGEDDIRQSLPIIFIVALVLGHILRSMLGRLPGSLVTSGFVAVMAWFIFGAVSMVIFAGVAGLLISLLGIGIGRRGFGGYSSGGGSGGGVDLVVEAVVLAVVDPRGDGRYES